MVIDINKIKLAIEYCKKANNIAEKLKDTSASSSITLAIEYLYGDLEEAKTNIKGKNKK